MDGERDLREYVRWVRFDHEEYSWHNPYIPTYARVSLLQANDRLDSYVVGCDGPILFFLWDISNGGKINNKLKYFWAYILLDLFYNVLLTWYPCISRSGSGT